MAVQLGLYASMLRGALNSPDIDSARPALIRWIKAAIAWQAVVSISAVAYVVVMTSNHATGRTWVAPAAGGFLGTALPLQIVVVAVLRAARR